VKRDLRGQRAANPSAALDLAALGIRPAERSCTGPGVDLKGQAAVSRSYEARILSALEAAARSGMH